MFAGFPCKGLLIIQRRRKKKEVFLILGGCFEEGGGGGGWKITESVSVWKEESDDTVQHERTNKWFLWEGSEDALFGVKELANNYLKKV